MWIGVVTAAVVVGAMLVPSARHPSRTGHPLQAARTALAGLCAAVALVALLAFWWSVVTGVVDLLTPG